MTDANKKIDNVAGTDDGAADFVIGPDFTRTTPPGNDFHVRRIIPHQDHENAPGARFRWNLGTSRTIPTHRS